MKQIRRMAAALVIAFAFAPGTGAQDINHAANRLAQEVFNRASDVFNNAVDVHYEHAKRPASEQVECNSSGCEARNDCSGFVSYVLHSVSPRHYREIRQLQQDRKYPQAKTFAHFFRDLDEHPAAGWRRLEDYHQLQPGDIIAWAKEGEGDHAGKGNSGHVMIVAATPSDEGSFETVGDSRVRLVPVFVLDSSSVKHFPPEELPPHAGQNHRDGLGKGTIRLLIDERGKPVGYWEGTYWGEGQKDIRRPSLSDEISFGRIIPFDDSK